MPALSTLPGSALSPQAVGERVNTLAAAGHEWMPADMQMTLASAPTSDNDMVSIANSIKTTLSKTWDGFTEAFDDPVLHKQPTTSLALSRLMHASLGPLPIAEEDLGSIQKSLQKAGFGGDLSANGVWGADWDDAYNSYSQHVITRQLAGDQPGSVSTGHAAHKWWQDFEPSNAMNAVIGYARSLPGDVRDLAASLVGDVANTGAGIFGDHRLLGLHPNKQVELNSPGAHAYTEVEKLLGNPHAEQATVKRVMHPDAALLQDVGTVLAVAPIVGTGARAAAVARGSFAEGVTAAAAQRGPGVIAKTLAGGLSKNDLEAAAARRGLLNTKVFTNIPLLGQVGPVVGRLADEDGLYYKARTLLATPYKYPAVRVAGDIGQRTLLTGAALRGGAQLSQAVAGPSTLTSDIQDTQATDLVDRNLDRIIGTPFAHPFTDAVNILGFVLHGPLGDTANSTSVGNAVQATTDAAGAALGHVGLHGIMQRAVQTINGGNLPSVDDLAAQFGGDEHLDRFILSKTADVAASHYAQRAAQSEGLEYGTAAYRQRVGELADEVWSDPTKHIGAVRELMADSGGIGLTNRFAADMQHSGMDAKDYTSDAVKWMQAGGHLTEQVRNGNARYLFGANGKTVIAEAQDDFDHGLGQDNPLRKTGATRRAYNAEVSHLMGRVRSGVTAARTQAIKNITGAQDALDDAKATFSQLSSTDDDFQDARVAVRKAQGRLQSAKIQQRKIEEALGSNLTYRLDDTFTKLRSPRGADAEWSRVASDVKRLRTLIIPGLGDGEKFDLSEALDKGINPDELYTKINGAPRPSDTGIGSGDWMREHLPHSDGALGLGRVDTKSVQAATNDLNGYEQQLATAADQADVERVIEELKDYGFREFGLTEKTLGVFDANPEALIDTLRERALDLASDVFLTSDAPQSVRDAVAHMGELGYKPMLGSHIGHMWDTSLPPIGDVDGAITRRRRIVGALGADPTQVTSRVAGQNARIRVLNEMQKEAADNPKVKLPPRTTPETVLAVMDDKGLMQPALRKPELLAYYASYPLHKPAIEQLMKSQGLDAGEAEAAHRAELMRALQVRDVPRKEFMKVLTTPGEFENGAFWQGMDSTSAALLYRAVLRGYAQRPNYIMGLSGIEDWGRAGFSMLDKLAHAFPDSGTVQAFANSPNAVIQLRNRARFTLSPFFDFRRVTKTNYKMGLDGVAPVANPMKQLVDSGTFDKAHELLSKIHGDVSTAGYDDADRYLHQQSIFGVYNSRHYEAYYAWQKHLDGATDDEIKKGLTKVFEYGSSRGAGRSALERSVNTVFFPFSFEKTLIRNTGMYLLDHPQQALLLTGAMDAYQKANSHDAISQWTADHLPVLRDLQKLNAFAHGIGPGEFGGINAPLANLFLPQVWDGKNFSEENLKKAIPIWSDFANLAADLHQQEIVAHNTVQNGLSYAIHLGAPRGPLDPYKPMETVQAQRRDAEGLRNKAILAFTDALSYNTHQSSDATKIRFGDQSQLPPGVQGQVVNRTSIGYLVKRWFPAYDPSFGQQYAIQQEAKADQQIAEITAKDPARGQSFSVFAKLANQVSEHLVKGDYDTDTAATTIAQFRAAAVAGAENDPDFYKFYNANYRWVFGPLEEVTK